MSEDRSALAHQFHSLEQQFEASRLGMWLFLATEVMFFGGVFTALSVYHSSYGRIFDEASRHLDLTLGAINTAVLISSSFTMAMAARSAQLGEQRRLGGYLAATIALGSLFLAIKFTEYFHKFEEHLVPGLHFSYPGPEALRAQLFFSFYFTLTGLHALHMVIGVGILLVLLGGAVRGRYSSLYHSPVELSGLYWHFVDIVWIFIFPLLYLPGLRH